MASQAYVLVKVAPRTLKRVLEQVRKMPAVAEAQGVFGDADIIAKIQAEGDLAFIADAVVLRIQEIEGVVETKTYPVF